MQKDIEVIKEGYENVVQVLKDAIATIETAEQQEIDQAVTSIKAKYADRLADYKEDLTRYVHVETVEVPDETTEECTTVEEEVHEEISQENITE